MINELKNPSIHLMQKMKHIVITNVCNLTCGGCHQNCGNFSKEKLWFIDPADFESYINILKKEDNLLNFPNKNFITKISIFGGEPTLHPQWNLLLSIMKNHQNVLFRVSTNGRLLKDIENPYPLLPLNVATLKHIKDIEKSQNQPDTNIFYIVDPKTEEKINNTSFIPTFIAPIDVYPKKSKHFFWYKAQEKCEIWKNCSASIYNKKAYFCEVAGAMDHMFYNGTKGWDINEKPFNKSIKEIEEQASHFCYRCAWCIKDEININQKINDPTFISKTNFIDIDKEKNYQLVEIKC